MKRIFVGLLLASLIVTSALAGQSSGTVQVTWRVLPVAVFFYPDENGSSQLMQFELEVPLFSPADLERGYIDIEPDLPAVIASNTDWAALIAIVAETDLGRAQVLVGKDFVSIVTWGRAFAKGIRGLTDIPLVIRVFPPDDPLEGVETLSFLISLVVAVR